MSVRLRAVALAATAVLGSSLISGCGAGQTTPVLLRSGTTLGLAWYLWAWEQKGSLCMSTGTAAGPDGGDITPPPNAVEGGQCEYTDKYPAATYYMSAEGGTDGKDDFTVSLVFGPLPSDATHIKVATHLTLTTQPFPSGKGLPTGRYWVWVDTYVPPASVGTVLDVPQPLDNQGKPVAFQIF
ncbi:hypothetical protein KDL01_05600 [Actinospica durhamensis]|uniref:Lipoprotein n=1 Tax=Actinospica durhamensis TaxID=1508375 RepID=A0A941IMD2_9ACTN|nr:hypothetical protein [Actinospica durhamensis]MBR7832724.1 hypothetical protein [Actinospica durhamensis]